MARIARTSAGRPILKCGIPLARRTTTSLSFTIRLYVNIMAAKTAMGPISDRKVGSSNIVKVTKVVAERPRFTIISTKRKDCVSQTMQVRLAATTMVHQTS